MKKACGMRGGRGESRNNADFENRDSRKGGVGFSGRMDKKSGFVFLFCLFFEGLRGGIPTGVGRKSGGESTDGDGNFGVRSGIREFGRREMKYKFRGKGRSGGLRIVGRSGIGDG